jgi:hypothetical protein
MSAHLSHNNYSRQVAKLTTVILCKGARHGVSKQSQGGRRPPTLQAGHL